jgi:PH domain
MSETDACHSSIASLAPNSKRLEALMNRWKKRYFVLDNGHLEHYEKQAYVGNNRRKTSMQLQARTVTSYTDTTNCFCVRTDNDVWFLLGNSEELMQQWMTAINAQVHALYLNVSATAAVVQRV